MPLEKFLEFAEIVRQYIATRNEKELIKDNQISAQQTRIADLEQQLADALTQLSEALSNDVADKEAIAAAQAAAESAAAQATVSQSEVERLQAELLAAQNDRASADQSLISAIETLQSEFSVVTQ